MPSILLLTRKTESAKMMTAYLHAQNLQDIDVRYDVTAALHYLSSKTVDIVLLDIPFTLDAQELTFALSITKQKQIFLLLLVKKEQYHRVREKVEQLGIFTISKPIIKDIFAQVVSFAIVHVYKHQQYQETYERLLDTIKEIKLVDHAKCLLIEHASMRENEAHQYIGKQAMNHRVTRAQIATGIVKKYDEE